MVSPGPRPAAATVGGIAHIASGCVTIAAAAAITYAGFLPVDPARDALWTQYDFGLPGQGKVDNPGFPFDGPAFLALSIAVTLCVAALGVTEVRIGRRALRGAGYFAAWSFGIGWCILSLAVANYPGFLLAGAAVICVWLARDWFREMDFAARDRVWSEPHRYKDWTLPDTPVPPAPPEAGPGEPGTRPD